MCYLYNDFLYPSQFAGTKLTQMETLRFNRQYISTVETMRNFYRLSLPLPASEGTPYTHDDN